VAKVFPLSSLQQPELALAGQERKLQIPCRVICHPLSLRASSSSLSFWCLGGSPAQRGNIAVGTSSEERSHLNQEPNLPRSGSSFAER
jgi:hypothetical protein